MAENYVLAEKDYMDGMKYKDIAEKYGVSINTVKSWKTRHKWSKDGKKKGVHTKPKRVHTKKEEHEPVVESDDLTDKQRLFCIYYIKYFSAIRAYQKAYECSYIAAHSNAHRMMANDGIRAEINRMKKDVADGLMLDASSVLQKYIDIAFADIGDYVERGDGGYSIVVRPLEEMDTSIISELSNTENGIKLKLADKMRALDFLSKYFDLLSDSDKKRLQEEQIKLDIEKSKLELGNLRGDTEGDPHAQGSSYEDALNAQTEEIFADEVMDDET